MIAILGWFCFMQLFGANEQNYNNSSRSIIYSGSFYWNKEDGTKQKIKLRIDKILSNLGYGSRAELKVYCKKGMVKVNDKVISNPGTQVDTDVDKIEFNNEVVNYREFVYIIFST